MKFVGIVGSNYEQSYNRKLLEFIRRQFKIKFELEVLEIDEVPMFNQDEKWDESFQLRYLYNKITRADGVIIATPEHNHTISAPLKSVLEWLSYEVHPFENKPVMIVGASYYDHGTPRAQVHRAFPGAGRCRPLPGHRHREIDFADDVGRDQIGRAHV